MKLPQTFYAVVLDTGNGQYTYVYSAGHRIGYDTAPRLSGMCDDINKVPNLLNRFDKLSRKEIDRFDDRIEYWRNCSPTSILDSKYIQERIAFQEKQKDEIMARQFRAVKIEVTLL